MLIGYARVTASNQTVELQKQKETLYGFGCTKFFHDVDEAKRVSHARIRRGFRECLHTATEGDTIVVCSLDRFGYRSDVLASFIATLGEQCVCVRSLLENIDTFAPDDGPILGFCHLLKEMEQELAQERILCGQTVPHQELRGGRKPSLDSQKVAWARETYQNQNMTVTEICQKLGISRTTFYRSLNRSVSPSGTSLCIPEHIIGSGHF